MIPKAVQIQMMLQTISAHKTVKRIISRGKRYERIFRKQGYKFQQFMVGRYGVDKLYRALLIFFFVFTILANLFYRVSKITYYAFEVMGFVLLVYAFSECFQKH